MRQAPQALLLPSAHAIDVERFFPTIEEVLELPALAGVRLLTNPATAAGRRIRGTSVQEIPLDDFVRRDELVMTTGIGLAGDDASLAAFATAIATSGAAGLAIAVGRYVQEVPASVIRAADSVGLPVLEFPWALRFSEVTELVLAQVVDRQHAWLRRSEEIHHLFNEIVLRGSDLPSLCRSIEELLGRPARVADRWGEAADGGPASLAGTSAANWEATAIRVPIAAERRPMGTLLLGAGAAPLSELDVEIAAHGATAAALIMMMQRASAESEARAQAEFISSVLAAPSPNARELERRAEALAIDPAQAFAVHHIAFASRKPMSDGELSEIGRWAVQRAMESRRTAALQQWDGPEVTLVVPLGTPPVASRARQLLDHVTANVARQSPGVTMTLGSGRVAQGLATVRESYREAVTATRLGSVLHGLGSRTEYADLGAYPALYEAVNADGSRPAFAALQERYLGVAMRYEADAGLPILETLAAFFAERGNVSATARALRINRQSLLYRLEKFELLSGVDMASPVDRFALELAVRCWRMNLGQLDAIESGPGGPA